MFIIFTILFLFLGNVVRTYRWHTLLISVSTIEPRKLIFSLSISYILNSILPIRIGDLFRLFYVGTRIRNILLVSSTLLFERLTDIFFLQMIFLSILFLHYMNINQFQNIPLTLLTESVVVYLGLLATIGILIVLVITNSKLVKFIIVRLANIFNVKSKISVLNSFFKFFQFNKQLFKYLNKLKYIYLTLSMWLFYILGYSFARKSFSQLGFEISGFELLINFTNPINYRPLPYTNAQFLVFIFYFFPAILLLFSYFLVPKRNNSPRKMGSYQLNFRNEEDRLLFLEDYFNSKDRYWSKAYYQIFQGYEIVKDFTGLSGARTVLLQDEIGKKYYRKFSIGQNNFELENQYKYMSNWSHENNFTNLDFKKTDDYFLYDMPFREGFMPLNLGINYVSKNDISSLLVNIIKSLDNSLYLNVMNVNNVDHLVVKYYSNKVVKNLNIIKNYLDHYSLVNSKSIKINGENLHFNFLDVCNFFSYNRENISNLLSKDKFTFSHGDLSAENIILNPSTLDFYFIDMLPPNDNLSSKANDLAKLRLSSKYNFELIRNQRVLILDFNEFNFPIFENYKMKFLDHSLESIVRKSIYESTPRIVQIYSNIHWLRVISRRIQSNDPNSLIYIGFFFLSIKDQIDSISPLN